MIYAKKNRVLLAFLSLIIISPELFAIRALKSKADFNAAINQTSGCVVIKFFATWCPPCTILAKTLVADIIPQYEDKVTFLEVDFDVCGALAKKYGINSLPTLLFFKDGKKIHTIVGGLSAKKLSAELDKQFNF